MNIQNSYNFFWKQYQNRLYWQFSYCACRSSILTLILCWHCYSRLSTRRYKAPMTPPLSTQVARPNSESPAAFRLPSRSSLSFTPLSSAQSEICPLCLWRQSPTSSHPTFIPRLPPWHLKSFETWWGNPRYSIYKLQLHFWQARSRYLCPILPSFCFLISVDLEVIYIIVQD